MKTRQPKFSETNLKLCLFILLFPAICYSQDKEVWVDKPISEWPTIALTNHVQFKNGDRYVHPSFTYAGTGFLIDTGADTLAATAKHTLWIAKNNKSSKVELNAHLKTWVMKPKGEVPDSVSLDILINEDHSEILEGPRATITERDWIVFSLKKSSKNIFPLKPRYSTPEPGEKAYILSCPYSEKRHTISEATLVRKEGMDLLLERDSATNLAGSSGSPVIDSDGHLIGILSSTTMDNTTGKSIGVAVSTEYLHKVLHAEADYNASKQDYGDLILRITKEEGVGKAIKAYKNLVKDPRNYYVYNLRSSNKNGLREAGTKLIELNMMTEGIKILELNARVHTNFYLNHNLLAKAYVQSGKIKKAIKSYRTSMRKYNDPDGNEAFAAMADLDNSK